MDANDINSDIGNEILKNLDPNFWFILLEEKEIRRRTITSLARVSRLLSDCALDVLWNTMSSIQPIVHTINSCATSTDDVVLAYVEDSHWDLRRPLDDNIRSRVRDRLRRIRTIGFGGQVDAKRSSLWVTLVGCMGQGEPLLPGLQQLHIHYLEKTYLSQLMLLIPATLRSVETNDCVGSSADGSLSLYRLLSSRNCSLEKISHSSVLSQELLSTFITFTDLRTLELRTPGLTPTQHTFPFSELLHHLPSLVNLSVDLWLFPVLDTSNPPFLQHYALETLHITGHPDDSEALLAIAEFPLLRSLSLAVLPKRAWSWSPLYDIVASRFPALSALRLKVQAIPIESPPLTLQTIAPFLSLRLTTFSMWFIRHQLTTEDLGTMINAWPELRVLGFHNPRGRPFDSTILLSLSQIPSLKQLTISLDFASLARPLGPNVVTPAKSVLKELSISELGWFPSTWEEKLMLAQNLLTLFPRLRTIYSTVRQGHDVKDVAAIIKAMNRTMAALSFRR